MTLNNATPHDMLQFAMDHFSRGIFHMPHSTPSQSQPLRQALTPRFSRSKSLYEIGDEVLLLAEKLESPEERKEWAVYADSVFTQIYITRSHRYQENVAAAASSSRDMGEAPPAVGEGLVSKARGRTYLVIGSTIAELIEDKMDQGSENDEAFGSLIRSEDADEARSALLRAIDFFEKAKTYIAEYEDDDKEEDDEEENDDDQMIVDDNDDADDEQEGGAFMSARSRGKQRRDSKTDEDRSASRLEAKRASRAEARRQYQDEAEEERTQISHLVAEALCSLANLTESKEQQEEYYRRAETETGVKLFGQDDEGMDED
jgi:hypothetical protein